MEGTGPAGSGDIGAGIQLDTVGSLAAHLGLQGPLFTLPLDNVKASKRPAALQLCHGLNSPSHTLTSAPSWSPWQTLIPTLSLPSSSTLPPIHQLLPSPNSSELK